MIIDINGRVAYISGPKTGFQNGNVDAFNEAQIYLKKQGYIVVNPHELGKDLYDKWSKLNTDSQNAKDDMWRDFLKLYIRHLTLCTDIFVLNGWDTSRGAILEILIGQKLGLSIWLYKDLTEFKGELHITKGKPISF